VETAAFWRQKIRANAFPPVKLADEAAAHRTGLLGHSVGAGIATYVAKQAAKEGQEFEAVMFMAPQTQVSGGAHVWHSLGV
jgi:acetyl esterase/lipase